VLTPARLLCLVTTVVVSQPLLGQESTTTWDAEVYLWAASIGGTGRAGGEIEVPFDELLEGFELGGSGGLGVRHNRWQFRVEGIFVAFGDQSAVSAPASTVTADYEIDTLALNLYAGRDLLETEFTTLAVFAGVRLLGLQTRFDLSRGTGAVTSSGSSQIWNGLVGAQFLHRLSGRWTIDAYADIGTGETALTWQAGGSLGYQLGRVRLRLGYRHLAWDFGRRDEGSRPFDVLSLSGPLVSLRYAF